VHRSGTQAEVPPRNFLDVYFLNFYKKHSNSFLTGPKNYSLQGQNFKNLSKSLQYGGFSAFVSIEQIPCDMNEKQVRKKERFLC